MDNDDGGAVLPEFDEFAIQRNSSVALGKHQDWPHTVSDRTEVSVTE